MEGAALLRRAPNRVSGAFHTWPGPPPAPPAPLPSLNPSLLTPQHLQLPFCPSIHPWPSPAPLLSLNPSLPTPQASGSAPHVLDLYSSFLTENINIFMPSALIVSPEVWRQLCHPSSQGLTALLLHCTAGRQTSSGGDWAVEKAPCISQKKPKQIQKTSQNHQTEKRDKGTWMRC